MPVSVTEADPDDPGAWLAGMQAAVAEVLSAEC
jgi:hypothetical protein